MAEVNIILSNVEGYTKKGDDQIPVMAAREKAHDNITSSSSSQQSAITADSTSDVWRITPSGGAIYARFGDNPTAVDKVGWLIPDGASLEVSAESGQKVAIIDAA